MNVNQEQKQVKVGQNFWILCPKSGWCKAVITGLTSKMIEYKRMCPTGSIDGFAYGAMMRDYFFNENHVMQQT